MSHVDLECTLHSEPELLYTPKGLAQASCFFAFPSGTPQAPPCILRLVLFGQLAEDFYEQYHGQGSLIIEGRLQIDTRTMSDGTTQRALKLVARRVEPHTAEPVSAMVLESAREGQSFPT